MKYYWLAPKDQRNYNWLFYEESNETGIKLRSQYTHLLCWKCRKLDELAAVAIGLDRGVKIRSKSDYLMTDDGLICVSARGQQILAQSNIVGLTYGPVSDDGRYAIALPTCQIPVDMNSVGMEFHRQCPECGRFRETCFFPTLASLKLDSNPLAVEFPNIAFEGTRGRKFFYLVSKDVVDLLRAAKFSGVELLPAA